MPVSDDKKPGAVAPAAAFVGGKYKNKHSLLMADLNERLRVALEDGVDPWGQGLSFAQILQEIKVAQECKYLLGGE